MIKRIGRRTIEEKKIFPPPRPIKLYKGATRIVKIEKLDDYFKGVAYIGEQKYTVRGAIKGETETVEVIDVNRKSGVECKFLSSEKPSADRVTPICDRFYECGNCDLMHINIQSQLKLKKQNLSAVLGVTENKINDVVSVNELYYRNKVHLVFGEKDGKINLGFFDETTHAVTSIEKCYLHDKWLYKLIKRILTWARATRVEAYKPWNGKGQMRFVAARCLGENIMVTLVSRKGAKLKSLDKLYESLKLDFKSVSLFTSENDGKSAMVLAGKLRHVAGDTRLKGSLCGIDFGLSPDSFFQVNERAIERIYSDIFAHVKKGGAKNVVDCFSGIGITSAMFAKSGVSVTSIEIVPSAVSDAEKLAEANGVKDKIKFIRGDVNKVLPKLDKSHKYTFFVDPPRSGLGEEVCLSIIGFAPNEIIYLSCNPQTLADDLKFLTHHGYKLVSVTPYDMFPNTKHIETLVYLSHK